MADNRSFRYAIVTPVRDEERHIDGTVESILAQSVRPVRWIIVNDGSRDGTAAIIDRYCSQHSWMEAVHRADRGFRKSGGGVVEAFYDGYSKLEGSRWDFLVKLDGDLTFGPDYFASCLERFRCDEELGIGGGGVYTTGVDGDQLERHPIFHVRGATKIYRRQCWEAISPLIEAPGWDTLDEVKANMLGWKTRSFPELKMIQHRPTGQADGAWKNAVKNGRANYISGYHPLFMLAKCIKRLVHKPPVVESLGLLTGFLGGYLKRIPQVEDRKLIRYLRRQQMQRLLLKESIWS